MSTSFQKYGIIAEVVSAAAIVISLIFVGLEIRQSASQTEQNTLARKVSTYQELISKITELNRIQIDNPELAQAVVKVETHEPVELTERESQILYRHSWILFRHGDIAYYQYQSGLLSQERLKSSLGPLVSQFEYPWYQLRWDQARVNFVPEYREFIDRIIQKKTFKVSEIQVNRE